MTSIKYFINRHSLLIYFILVFAFSWGAIFILVGRDGFPVKADQIMVLGVAMLIGPSVAGILLTALASGREGFRDLVSRLFQWRVNARWYAVALLIAPISTLMVLILLSLFSNEFLPAVFTSDDRAGLVMMGIVGGLTVGFFEELGWTGFAIPRMRRRYGVAATGFIIGVIWGAWHFLLFWENDSFSGLLPLALLLARLFSWLPAYRILMVWVYDSTESFLLAILMHTSLVATLSILDPTLTGAKLLIFILIRAVVFWGMVAIVTLHKRRST